VTASGRFSRRRLTAVSDRRPAEAENFPPAGSFAQGVGRVKISLMQPEPRDWDLPIVDSINFDLGRDGKSVSVPIIDLANPRWNSAPVRVDEEQRIFVANHVACRRCGAVPRPASRALPRAGAIG
jgi:hypothetical protein